MPQPATTPTPPHDAPDSLRVALEKYHYSQATLDDLRRAYDRYMAREEELEKPKTYFQSLIEGFQSFNIALPDAHDRFIDDLKHETDEEAIRACWEDVGEYLSYAMIKHILEADGGNEERR